MHRFRQRRASTWLHIAVALIVLAATVLSSSGATASHGLAALAVADHTGGGDADAVGHPAEPGTDAAAHGEAAHSHHGSDHSHDKGSARASDGATHLPCHLPRHVARLEWVKRVMAYRLERPPRA